MTKPTLEQIEELIESGKTVEAESLLALLPESAAKVRCQVYCLIANGEARNAAKLSAASLRRYPKDADLWRAHADAAYEAGRFRRAFDAYQRSLELEPCVQETVLGLTYAADEIGKRREAISIIEHCYGTNPPTRELSLALATLLSFAGEQNRAQALAQQWFTRKPDDSEAALILGRALICQRQWEHAVSVLNAISDQADPQVLMLKAQIQLGRGDPSEAVRLLEVASEVSGTNSEVNELLMSLYRQRGDMRAMWKLFKRIGRGNARVRMR